MGVLRRLGHAALAACAALTFAACGGDDDRDVPPPRVDLLRQADVAAEVIHAARLERHLAGLSPEGRADYVAAELKRLGFHPASPRGEWRQVFEVPRKSVQASAFELQRGEARLGLQAGRDFVAALGSAASTVRLGGREVVFADRGLNVPAGSLAGKVVVVPSPAPGAGAATARREGAGPAAQAPAPGRGAAVAPAQPPAPGQRGEPPQAGQPAAPAVAPAPGAAISELLRRAAAAGAVAVVLVPPYTSNAPLPTPVAAGEMAAGTGIPAAVWVTEPAARNVFSTLLATGLSFLPRLEGRLDVLPLAMGRVGRLALTSKEAKARHFNVVARLPAREGGADEVVVVAAPLGGTAKGEVVADLDGGARGEAAALAQLLGVAAACQAVSERPGRTLVFAAVDSSGDGTIGARRLVQLVGTGQRVAAAVVLSGGNLLGPTEDVTFIGLRASPLSGVVQRVAQARGRRVGGDPAPARGVMWRSPAWAFIESGIPAVLLEPGTTPRAAAPPPFAFAAAPAPSPAGRPGAAARATPTPPPAYSPGRQVEGMVEDARLTFRLVLELLETDAQIPRVDPDEVAAKLRKPPPPPAPAAGPPVEPGRPVAGRPGAAPPAIAGTAPGAGTGGAGAGTGAPAPDAGPADTGRIRVERSSPGPLERPQSEEAEETDGPATDGPSFMAPPAATAPPPPPGSQPGSQLERPPGDPADEAPADEAEPEPQPTVAREAEPDRG